MGWAGGGLAVFTSLLGAAQSAATLQSPRDQGTEAIHLHFVKMN